MDVGLDPSGSETGVAPAAPSEETAPSDPLSGACDTAELVEEDLVVEEVSIDGMCGVY